MNTPTDIDSIPTSQALQEIGIRQSHSIVHTIGQYVRNMVIFLYVSTIPAENTIKYIYSDGDKNKEYTKLLGYAMTTGNFVYRDATYQVFSISDMTKVIWKYTGNKGVCMYTSSVIYPIVDMKKIVPYLYDNGQICINEQ